MSDPYAFRPGGSLKLKRSGDGAEGRIKKKKKSKIDQDRISKADSREGSSKAEGSGVGSSSQGDAAPSDTPPEKTKDDNKTDAERRFEEMQRKRRDEKIKKLAATTHKDRVHEFNSKLESLSEHHDIPKVGPG